MHTFALHLTINLANAKKEVLRILGCIIRNLSTLCIFFIRTEYLYKIIPGAALSNQDTTREHCQGKTTNNYDTDSIQSCRISGGGAGFIGSHLCDRLIDDGYKVICIDNLYTGSLHNIEHLMSHPRFTFVNHDVTAPYDMTGLSLIFNLACPASPVHYQKDAVYTSKTAYLGTLYMLDLARKNDCVILQASTSEVYGNPLVPVHDRSYTLGSYYDRSNNFLITLKTWHACTKAEVNEDILRNLPYASRGMVFEDQKLRSFFESQWWYMPNTNYHGEENDFTDSERRLLNNTISF